MAAKRKNFPISRKIFILQNIIYIIFLFRIGMPVKVRVSKIEPSTKQIFLDFGDQLNNSAINVPLKTTEKKVIYQFL